jgi:uncharacterized protein YlaN (UPF0358 family)
MTERPDGRLSYAIVDAEYVPASVAEHAGNPLIEALPPFSDTSDMMSAFGLFPVFDEGERSLPNHIRVQLVLRINRYLEPLPAHLEVAQRINLVLRDGYAGRNPIDESVRRDLVRFYRESMAGKVCPIGTFTPATPGSFAIFGTSGVGKSTVSERALSFLPQGIRHPRYKFVQLVWLKLDCPPDGRLKQLLLAILAKIDALLGTSYRKDLKYRKTSIDELIIEVAKIAAGHNLGMLVIDEVQNLLDACGVSQSTMLNFFVTFANEVKIPLLLIGTPRAFSMLEGTFREARRIGDFGIIVWDALRPALDWEFFLEGLFKYQWTRRPVALTKEISDILYDLTLGVHALVVRLFQLTQIKAISTGEETISTKLLKETALAEFRLIQPMLNAMRSGDAAAMSKYEDLLSTELIGLSKKVEAAVKMDELKVQAQARRQMIAERARTVSALVTLGLGETEARQIVDALFETSPEIDSATAMFKILGALERNPSWQDTDSRMGLREVVEVGTAQGQTALEALKEAGIIATPLSEARKAREL